MPSFFFMTNQLFTLLNTSSILTLHQNKARTSFAIPCHLSSIWNNSKYARGQCQNKPPRACNSTATTIPGTENKKKSGTLSPISAQPIHNVNIPDTKSESSRSPCCPQPPFMGHFCEPCALALLQKSQDFKTMLHKLQHH